MIEHEDSPQTKARDAAAAVNRFGAEARRLAASGLEFEVDLQRASALADQLAGMAAQGQRAEDLGPLAGLALEHAAKDLMDLIDEVRAARRRK